MQVVGENIRSPPLPPPKPETIKINIKTLTATRRSFSCKPTSKSTSLSPFLLPRSLLLTSLSATRTPQPLLLPLGKHCSLTLPCFGTQPHSRSSSTPTQPAGTATFAKIRFVSEHGALLPKTHPTLTVEAAGLEDGDEIDVVLEQIGG